MTNTVKDIITTTTILAPFHLAFPVKDIESTREFYTSLLGATVGREDTQWIDFDLYGHQISAHVSPGHTGPVHHNAVDGDAVPVPHFGVVLAWNDWQALSERLKKLNVRFLIEPHIRFAGQPGEQATLFIADPSGNALEFKSFQDMSKLFARE